MITRFVLYSLHACTDSIFFFSDSDSSMRLLFKHLERKSHLHSGIKRCAHLIFISVYIVRYENTSIMNDFQLSRIWHLCHILLFAGISLCLDYRGWSYFCCCGLLLGNLKNRRKSGLNLTVTFRSILEHVCFVLNLLIYLFPNFLFFVKLGGEISTCVLKFVRSIIVYCRLGLPIYVK